MKQYRPRRPSPYMGFRGRSPYVPPPFMYSPYGYGYASRKFPCLSHFDRLETYLSCFILTFHNLCSLQLLLQKGSEDENANALQPLLLNHQFWPARGIPDRFPYFFSGMLIQEVFLWELLHRVG